MHLFRSVLRFCIAILPVCSPSSVPKVPTRPLPACSSTFPESVTIRNPTAIPGITSGPTTTTSIPSPATARATERDPRNLNFNKLTGNAWNRLDGSLSTRWTNMAKAGKVAQRSNWKVTGGDCIDGVLLRLHREQLVWLPTAFGGRYPILYLRQTVNNMSLIKSTDKGRTWSRDVEANYDSPMWTSPKFSTAFFFKYGRNGGHDRRTIKTNTSMPSPTTAIGIADRILPWPGPARENRPISTPADWQYFSHGHWSASIDDATPIAGLSQRPDEMHHGQPDLARRPSANMSPSPGTIPARPRGGTIRRT